MASCCCSIIQLDKSNKVDLGLVDGFFWVETKRQNPSSGPDSTLLDSVRAEAGQRVRNDPIQTQNHSTKVRHDDLTLLRVLLEPVLLHDGPAAAARCDEGSSGRLWTCETSAAGPVLSLHSKRFALRLLLGSILLWNWNTFSHSAEVLTGPQRPSRTERRTCGSRCCMNSWSKHLEN